MRILPLALAVLVAAFFGACSGGSSIPGDPIPVQVTLQVANQSAHPTTEPIAVRFSGPMDPATITESTLRLLGPLGFVQALVAYANQVATLVPKSNLAFGQDYTLICAPTIATSDGASLGRELRFPIRTAPNPPKTDLEVTQVDPAHRSVVAIPRQLSVVFNKAVDVATVTNASFVVSTGSDVVPGTIRAESGATIFRFTPASAFVLQTTYAIRLATTIRAQDGTGMRRELLSVFSTESKKPVLLGTTPKSNTVVDSVNLITFEFDQPMNTTTFNAQTCIVAPQGGAQVDGTFIGSGNNLYFRPKTVIRSPATYDVTLMPTLQSRAGKNFNETHRFSVRVRSGSGTWHTEEAVAAKLVHGAQYVVLDAAPSGAAIVGYHRTNDTGLQLDLYAVTRAAAGGWSKPFFLKNPGNLLNGNNLKVAVNSAGRAIVAWSQITQKSPQKSQLWVRYFNGATWSAITAMDSTTSYYGFRTFAIHIDESGFAGVIWQGNTVSGVTPVHVSGTGTGVFGASRTILSGQLQGGLLQTLYDEHADVRGNRIVLWSMFGTPTREIFALHFKRGLGFVTATSIFKTSGWLPTPRYFHVTDSGKALFVSSELVSRKTNIHYNFFDGSKWLTGGHRTLADFQGHIGRARFLMANSGDAVMVRPQTVSPTYAMSRRFSAATGLWATAQPLGDINIAGDDEFLLAGDGATELHCVWRRRTSSWNRYVQASYDFTAKKWGAVSDWKGAQINVSVLSTPKGIRKMASVLRYGTGNVLGFNSRYYQMCRYLSGRGWMAPVQYPGSSYYARVSTTSSDGAAHVIEARRVLVNGKYENGVYYRRFK